MTTEKHPIYAAIDRAFDASEMKDVMAEYASNMGFELKGLPAYGLRKVARYMAIVTFCELTDTSLFQFKGTPEEFARHQDRIMHACLDAGKPVIVTDGETVRSFEPKEESPDDN